jgi:ribose transport system substrate-binding protein
MNSNNRPRRAVLRGAVLATLLVGAATACGSDDATSSTAAPATTGAAPATDSAATTAGAEATTTAAEATATTTGGTASGDGVEQAKAVVAELMKDPTTIGATVPLTAKPTAGKKFIYLECNAGSCPYVGDQLEAAVGAAGWDFERIPFDIADPANLIAAMDTALQSKPVAVFFSGLPEAVWAQEVPKYKEAGVAIIVNSGGELTIDDTVIFYSNSPQNEVEAGKALGAWFVADSGGAGKGLVVTIPDIPILNGDGVKQALDTYCPDCETTELQATIDQVQSNTITPAVVAALQRDPSIKYVLSTQAQFMDGLPAALSGAGLSGIKVAGLHGSNKSMADLLTGDTSMMVGNPLGYMAWIAVDAAIRHDQGTEFDSEAPQPIQIITKDNVGTVDDLSFSLEKPTDYPDQFKKLWLVS